MDSVAKTQIIRMRPELPRARRDPMAMELLEIDFVAYMWVIGILMAMVTVAGCFYVLTSFRRHDRRREGTMPDPPSRHTWPADSADSFGHR